jgi:hypothetical protein
MQHDPLAPIRLSFEEYGGLPRQPFDRELANIAYMVKVHRSAPVSITHGKAHQDLREAVRTLLNTLPGLIEAAGDEAKAAHAEVRATDMGRFAARASALLSAAESFRSVVFEPPEPTPPTEPGKPAPKPAPPRVQRRDRRSHWHGMARLMAKEIRRIFRACGVPECSFGYAGAPAVRVLTDLIGKPATAGQVVEALRDRTGE